MKLHLAIGLIIATSISLLVGCTAVQTSNSTKNNGASELLHNVKYSQTTVEMAKTADSTSIPTASEYGYKSTNDIPYLLFKVDGTGVFNVNYLDGVVCQPMTYTVSGSTVTICYNQNCKIDVKITGKKTLKCISTYQSKTGMTKVDDNFSTN